MEREPYLKVQALLLSIGHQLKELDTYGFIGAIDLALPSTPDQSTIDSALNIKRLAQAATLYQDAYNALVAEHKNRSAAPRMLTVVAAERIPAGAAVVVQRHVPAPEPAVFEPNAFKP